MNYKIADILKINEEIEMDYAENKELIMITGIYPPDNKEHKEMIYRTGLPNIEEDYNLLSEETLFKVKSLRSEGKELVIPEHFLEQAFTLLTGK